MDHRPDGRSLESLRQDVRDELAKDQREDDVIELKEKTDSLALQAQGGGIADEEGLGWAAKNTRNRLLATPEEKTQNVVRLSEAIRTVLECIGEDPYREGLLRTPERYAKALLWMTKGYEERLVDVINDGELASHPL